MIRKEKDKYHLMTMDRIGAKSWGYQTLIAELRINRAQRSYSSDARSSLSSVDDDDAFATHSLKAASSSLSL